MIPRPLRGESPEPVRGAGGVFGTRPFSLDAALKLIYEYIAI
jgi:hypothetical protein